MKKYIIMGLCAASTSITISSCKKESFGEFYRNPAKVTETTVEKQFAGMIYGYRQLTVPDYRNYFVTVMPTVARYIQIDGWANEANQLTPGAAAIEDRWARYYEGLAQFRELETVYNNADDVVKADTRIFHLAAKIFFYDQTQQIVDLHGSIPWSEAGKLSSNGGDYTISYPKYDSAEDIYTAMLDDLKSISSELNGITIPSTSSFAGQDLINNGSLDLWKKYCNSLRVRMLSRVSSAASFAARAQSELEEIIGNPSTYPLILTNADNAQLDVFDPSTGINANGFQDALESWNGNIAGKVMIDHMLDNEDPRLPFIFEPGAEADGEFIGLDPMLTGSVQSNLITGPASGGGGTLAIYNRSTFSRNDYFPGVLITASEVNFLLSEYYAKAGNSGTAQTYFEDGIKESIALFQQIRGVSNDNITPAAGAPTQAAINNYIANIGWGTSNLQLIAMQKWLHFNMMQPFQNWAEVRRLNYPTFEFRLDPSDIQKTVPAKWPLPSSEPTFNSENYSVVASQDNVDTKLFWDVD